MRTLMFLLIMFFIWFFTTSLVFAVVGLIVCGLALISWDAIDIVTDRVRAAVTPPVANNTDTAAATAIAEWDPTKRTK